MTLQGNPDEPIMRRVEAANVIRGMLKEFISPTGGVKLDIERITALRSAVYYLETVYEGPAAHGPDNV